MTEIRLNMPQTEHQHHYAILEPEPHPEVTSLTVIGDAAGQDCGATHDNGYYGSHTICKSVGVFNPLNWHPDYMDSETDTEAYENDDVAFYTVVRTAIGLDRQHQHSYNQCSKRTEAYNWAFAAAFGYGYYGCGYKTPATVRSGCLFFNGGSPENTRNYDKTLIEMDMKTLPGWYERVAIGDFRRQHRHDYEWRSGDKAALGQVGSNVEGLTTCLQGHTDCMWGLPGYPDSKYTIDWYTAEVNLTDADTGYGVA